jgi:hypothetical protein
MLSYISWPLSLQVMGSTARTRQTVICHGTVYTHKSEELSWFSNGAYGAYYAASSLEMALRRSHATDG